MSRLKQAWQEFAELRKHQIAEYNLLNNDFSLEGVIVTLVLANPFEEPLLLNIRVQLIAHLRGRLNNNSITVASVLKESEGKKVAHTDKEKFILMAEKNPALKELKERFGLDTDY